LEAVVPSKDPAERKLIARRAALIRWSREGDPVASTKLASDAFLAKFRTQVDPQGALSEAERERRAVRAHRAHMIELSRKAAAARRKKKVA
jgi:hypothetical protein